MSVGPYGLGGVLFHFEGGVPKSVLGKTPYMAYSKHIICSCFFLMPFLIRPWEGCKIEKKLIHFAGIREGSKKKSLIKIID